MAVPFGQKHNAQMRRNWPGLWFNINIQRVFINTDKANELATGGLEHHGTDRPNGFLEGVCAAYQRKTRSGVWLRSGRQGLGRSPFLQRRPGPVDRQRQVLSAQRLLVIGDQSGCGWFGGMASIYQHSDQACSVSGIQSL